MLILGCGYIGRRLARRYLDCGDRVLGVVRSEQSATGLERAGIPACICDLAVDDLSALPLGGARVFHCAPPPTRGTEDLHTRRLVAAFARGGNPQRIVYLQRAIDHYERGTKLDLNDYYPSSNLPRLYRERGHPGDDDKARIAGVIAMLACERAGAINPDDEWLRPTLLGAAFDAESVPRAQALAVKVQMESAGMWKLETTIRDLRRATEQASQEHRAGLVAVFNQLNAMLPPEQRVPDLETSYAAAEPVEPSAEKPEKKKGKKKKGKKKKKK
jgi:hypothetical protein